MVFMGSTETCNDDLMENLLLHYFTLLGIILNGYLFCEK